MSNQSSGAKPVLSSNIPVDVNGNPVPLGIDGKPLVASNVVDVKSMDKKPALPKGPDGKLLELVTQMPSPSKKLEDLYRRAAEVAKLEFRYQQGRDKGLKVAKGVCFALCCAWLLDRLMNQTNLKRVCLLVGEAEYPSFTMPDAVNVWQREYLKALDDSKSQADFAILAVYRACFKKRRLESSGIHHATTMPAKLAAEVCLHLSKAKLEVGSYAFVGLARAAPKKSGAGTAAAGSAAAAAVPDAKGIAAEVSRAHQIAVRYVKGSKIFELFDPNFGLVSFRDQLVFEKFLDEYMRAFYTKEAYDTYYVEAVGKAQG